MAKEAIQFDTRQFERALAEFGKEVGVAGHKVLRNQMRLFTQNLVRTMPPKTKGVGNKAIVLDVSKVIGSVRSMATLDALDEIFGDRLWPLEFEPHIDRARDQAEKYRTKKGRVKYRASTVVLNGGKKWSQKMHTTKRNRNQIIREKKAKVGQAKAGFVPAARMFKARIPGWVTRHRMPGTATDKFNERTGKGYVEVVNKVPHAARHKTLAAAVMQGRFRAMRSQLNKEMRTVSKKHSAR